MTRRATGIAAILAVFGVVVCSSTNVRGGLEEDTRVLAPNGMVPIQKLSPNATVWTVEGDQLRPATVEATSRAEPGEYLELTVAGRTLRVTPEHPFQVEPGVFRVASKLRIGDPLFVRERDVFRTRPIDSITTIKAVKPAYDLVVTGGTFLANGVVVHNDGCFLPDTTILRADGSKVAIQDVKRDDVLLAFDHEGKITRATVRNVLTRVADEHVVIATERVTLKATREHPFYVGDGTFKTLDALKVGDSVYGFDGSGLVPQKIASIERVASRTTVYNLQTDSPNTFFANGIAVHNKHVAD